VAFLSQEKISWKEFSVQREIDLSGFGHIRDMHLLKIDMGIP
jgi:hypothetical protein